MSRPLGLQIGADFLLPTDSSLSPAAWQHLPLRAQKSLHRNRAGVKFA
jgi:hypothetical protein